MAGALAHTAAVPHGIDYPFPFSFRQAEHLPFDFLIEESQSSKPIRPGG